MSAGNITLYSEQAHAISGGQTFAVAASATTLNVGEPVTKALGANVVTPMTTNKPVVATDFLAGVSITNSTHTSTAAGIVSVAPIDETDVWLIAPNSTAAFDTQAEYDALVGDRVLLDLTTGVYTILATDGATNGCVIQPLDISKHPGRVAFSFRAGCSYLA